MTGLSLEGLSVEELEAWRAWREAAEAIGDYPGIIEKVHAEIEAMRAESERRDEAG